MGRLNASKEIALNDLVEVLYGMLPASGNSATSFPLAATRVGLSQYWEHGSKRPALTRFLTLVLEDSSHRTVPLIEEICRQALLWRQGAGKTPLSSAEIEQVNLCLGRLGYRSEYISDLQISLADREKNAVRPVGAKAEVSDIPFDNLLKKLVDIGGQEPQQRGYSFERYLHELFSAFALRPRGAFRIGPGEQIDGSIQLGSDVYLVEAKWVGKPVAQSDLLVLSGKVEGKSKWSRGLFFSMSGFSIDGVNSLERGRSTNLICFDGQDLVFCLTERYDLRSAILDKARLAAESNRIFVPIRELGASRKPKD